MLKFIIVSEFKNLINSDQSIMVIDPDQFIKDFSIKRKALKKTKVINLCKSYEYLSKGYYVSLLAEAKGFKCLPKVSDIIKLQWKRNYEFALAELNALLNKYLKDDHEEPLMRVYTSFFGRHENENIEPLSRKLFDLFRFPILSFEIKYSKKNLWEISKIEPKQINTFGDSRMAFFHKSLKQFTGSAWKEKDSSKKQEKYWIAILHNPEEKMPPSNKAALKKFIKIGKQMNLWIELINMHDYSSLLEYDAIFIRETTAVNNHTFKFASKAESEDIPCIDDTQSIIKCCNKVFLHELMNNNNIATPNTIIIDKKNIDSLLEATSYPCVLKIPDGSFSLGVTKANNPEEMKKKAHEMLKKSEIILCQEFLESEFDWRIGVLNNEVLFAIKYFMAKDHWQIYNHGVKLKKHLTGAVECVAIEDVPENVLNMAINACKKIGKGLYGADIKGLKDGSCVLIEINDNPNIDEGVEDALLGDELYIKILKHLVHLIES